MVSWLFPEGTRSVVADYLQRLNRPPARPSPFSAISRKLFIAMTARTGSTFLCQRLAKYGVIPSEHFNLARIEEKKAVHSFTDYHQYCEYLIHTEARHGAFGVKGHVDMTIPLFLVHEFPKNIKQWRFVYLTRANMVRQAISVLIANKTQTWVSWVARQRTLTDEDYSRDEIGRCLVNEVQARAWWEHFFAVYEIEPLRLTYEALIADTDAVVDQVARHCGLVASDEAIVRRLRESIQIAEPQTTEFNAIWEARFRAEAPQCSMTE